jgi:hypothetical protein
MQDKDSELVHLQKLVSEGGAAHEKDGGHVLTAGASSHGRSSPASSRSSAAQQASNSADVGHVLACASSNSLVSWERAHSAPILPKLESADQLASHPVRGDASSFTGDDVESVLSAPGNVEMPVTAVEAALESDLGLQSLRPAATADPGRSKSAGGLVARYAAMFEAHQPAISLPGWQRQELRGRSSTDFVLRFLNRHRRPRAQKSPPASVPEGAAPEGAALAHHSDSDENSGSEDEHEDGERDGQRLPDSASEGFRTPPRAHSPTRTRASTGRSGSDGSPSGRSRLGDSSRAAVADYVSSVPVLLSLLFLFLIFLLLL